MNKRTIEVAMIILGVAGALFLVPGAEAAIENTFGIEIPTSMLSVIVILGLVFLAVGLLMLLIDFICSSINRLRDPWKNILDYDSRVVSQAELRSAYSFCKKHFGNDVASLKTMKRWQTKYPEYARFIVWTRTTKSGHSAKSRIMGFLDIIPLTDQGEEELKKGTSIVNLNDTHVPDRHTKPACVYIGGIVGTDRIAKARVIQAVTSSVEEFKARGVSRFYTRPTTEEGLRIVKKYGFERLDGDPCTLNQLALYQLQ